MVLRVWDVGFGVVLGSGVWGVGFGGRGLASRVWGLGGEDGAGLFFQHLAFPSGSSEDLN